LSPSFVAIGLLVGAPGQAATAAPPGVVATQQTAPASSSSAPELSDPLADPAASPTQPVPIAASDTPIDPAAAPAEAAPSVTAAAHGHAPGDPLEHFNRHMFKIHQGIDHAAIRPLAMGYKHVVPKFLRSGFRHMLSNLFEPIVFLNDLLQLKPGRAVKTLARFVINTGYGVGGLIDVAKNHEVGLPYRHNGFGDTLGYYGVKPGPYLFLPLVGPTDLRDVFGGQVDGAVLPVAIGYPFNEASYQISSGVVGGLDQRAEADGDLKSLFDTAVDPYATLRSVYLQYRAGEIAGLHNKPIVTTEPGEELQDPLADPAAGAASVPSGSTPPDAGSSAPELSDPLADPAPSSAAQPPAAPPAPQAPSTARPTSSSAPELSDPLADPAATPAPAK
jgi:phospholipid-binding lipoprotein MlaA